MDGRARHLLPKIANLKVFLEHVDVSFLRILTSQHVDDLAVLEKNAGRDPANIVFGRGRRIFIDVEFVDFDFALELASEFVKGRGQRFTWAAPFSPKIDQGQLVRFQNIGFKACVVCRQNILSHGDLLSCFGPEGTTKNAQLACVSGRVILC